VCKILAESATAQDMGEAAKIFDAMESVRNPRDPSFG
jgi:hypothetical protein